MKITNCLMNHLENPLGFAMDAPVFSYQVEDAAGKHQAAARIRISADAQGQQVLADTGFAPLNSLGERIALPLRPCTRYWWTAAVRTDAGEEAASEPHVAGSVDFLCTGRKTASDFPQDVRGGWRNSSGEAVYLRTGAV